MFRRRENGLLRARPIDRNDRPNTERATRTQMCAKFKNTRLEQASRPFAIRMKYDVYIKTFCRLLVNGFFPRSDVYTLNIKIICIKKKNNKNGNNTACNIHTHTHDMCVRFIFYILFNVRTQSANINI